MGRTRAREVDEWEEEDEEKRVKDDEGLTYSGIFLGLAAVAGLESGAG